MKWKTKNGVEINIKDMETSHIQNVINMIEENSVIKKKVFNDTGYDGDSYVPDFIKIERKPTKKELKKGSKIYNKMCEELKKRLTNKL